MTQTPPTLLAVLGRGLVDPDTPVLRADDLGVVRGDGCFEGIRIVTDPSGRSRISKLDRHLARFARSAAALDIAFDEAGWRELIELARTAWTVPGEAGMRPILTRGSRGVPTGFLTITPASPDYARQRSEGIAVVTLPRGYTSAAFVESGWLLGGVKTLSYAVNMAGMREADRNGAQDAIFLSADGDVLEAPTGSVVWARGRTLRTTPTGPTGILAGTTQALLFDTAAAAGWDVGDALVPIEELRAADAIWITSSVRGPVEVVTLDGQPRERRPDLTAQITQLSGF